MEMSAFSLVKRSKLQEEPSSDDQLSPQLDDDSIQDILVTLPVKSLARFSVVHTAWMSLITGNATFIKEHFRHHSLRKKEAHLLVTHYDGEKPSPKFSIVEVTEGGGVRVEPFRFNPPAPSFVRNTPEPIWTFRSVCRGLVCLVYGRITVFARAFTAFVWNPFYQKFREVPCPTSYTITGDFGLWNLGYDPATHDYKIIALVDAGWNYSDSRLAIHLFSLKTNTWKRIFLTGDCRTTCVVRELITTNSVATDDGLMYFIVLGALPDSTERRLCGMFKFSLADERFTIIAAPPVVLSVDDRDYSLGLHNRSPCLYNARFGMIDIWISNQDFIWSKIMSIPEPIRCKQIGMGLINSRFCIAWTKRARSSPRVGDAVVTCETYLSLHSPEDDHVQELQLQPLHQGSRIDCLPVQSLFSP